jgi:hypothetical protein
MHTRERALAVVERELHVRLPRALFAPGGHGPYDAAVEPEALLDARAGAVRGGEMLPDALPVAGDPAGNWLLLRFAPDGAPRELVEWRADGGWHPSELVEAFPSDAARLRARCAVALGNRLQTLARETGEASLAEDLGVSRDTFSDWLLDARRVPDGLRAPFRRLTGASDAALFDQDWEGAAAAALRASEARPELAWPGAVLGWYEEGRGAIAAAARAYAAALRAFAGTLDLAERFGRPGERSARVLAVAFERCGGDAGDDATLRAAIAGPQQTRAHHLAESDRLRAAGRLLDACAAALRAGWHRHVVIDMDDVLGRLGDAAEGAGALAHAALARLHLRAWAAARGPAVR